jgi:hypothetical protein
MEGLDGFQNLVLLTDVTVQLAAPRAFLYTQDSGRSQIDVKAPVYYSGPRNSDQAIS